MSPTLTEQDVSPQPRLVSVCRPFVEDLFQPKPWVYWTDFLLTITLAYSASGVYLTSPIGSARWLLFLPVSAVLLYRLAMFIHEVVHLKSHQVPGFHTTWNLLAGVPLLMPSFLYESHLKHHSSQHYGTDRDGEYLPLAHGTTGHLLGFLSQVFYQPLFVFGRFLIGTPLSVLHPRLRKWVLARASSLVIDFSYRRKPEVQTWTSFSFWIEWACCLRAWTMVAVILFGIQPWYHLLNLYLLACCALGANHLRTTVAHRYRNEGDEMSHDDQFLDSTNVRGNWLTELWSPLGLRYHALHHLLPAIPYHHLGEAHRRLMEGLPPDSTYREVNYDSFMDVFAELWQTIRQRKALDPSMRNRDASRRSKVAS